MTTRAETLNRPQWIEASRAFQGAAIFTIALLLGLTSGGAARAGDGGLQTSLEVRLRHESMDNSFRAGEPGTDEVLFSRVIASVEGRGEWLQGGLELQDSRAFFDDRSTPLGTDDVNTLEFLQAWGGIRADGLGESDDSLDLRLGRMTVHLGRGRVIGRNIYRNTINGFFGGKLDWARAGAFRAEFFLLDPMDRRPGDREALDDNDYQFDSVSETERLWGVNVGDLSALPVGTGELYVVQLDEDDRDGRQTRDRDLTTFGGRWFHAAGDSWWEIEAALQWGDQSASTEPGARTLDHRAGFLHAEWQYTFDTTWQPELLLALDYASGDRDPDDDRFERYDPIYDASRVLDLAYTGNFGLYTRSNLLSPMIAVNVKPGAASSLRFRYRPGWLAEKRDELVGTGLSDPSGAAGSMIGHQYELTFTWKPLDWFQLKLGGAYIDKGDFLRRAPDAPDSGNTAYLFTELTGTF